MSLSSGWTASASAVPAPHQYLDTNEPGEFVVDRFEPPIHLAPQVGHFATQAAHLATQAAHFATQAANVTAHFVTQAENVSAHFGTQVAHLTAQVADISANFGPQVANVNAYVADRRLQVGNRRTLLLFPSSLEIGQSLLGGRHFRSSMPPGHYGPDFSIVVLSTTCARANHERIERLASAAMEFLQWSAVDSH
jgi:hypothetical protein